MITSFNGNYRFLSNFHPAKVVFEGFEYPTTEHAYQAAKTLNAGERKKIRNADTPGLAKRLGKLVSMRSDWEVVKFDIMEDLLRKKFVGVLATKLINTGNEELIEGNTWGDVIWGAVENRDKTWKGDNNLGKLLMKVRTELQS